mmetsp:Transcript_48291/g.121588  ORF Transcript_48291/g.121588 Transcript_48291/m.121588 type:complete len:339 (+) Transcript_48291:126-1142(+)
MSLLHLLVANGETVLAHTHTADGGNLEEITGAVLASIASEEKSSSWEKRTFLLRNQYATHVRRASPLVFACVCERAYPSRDAFALLDAVRVRFCALYGFAPRGATLSLDGDFGPLLDAELATHNLPPHAPEPSSPPGVAIPIAPAASDTVNGLETEDVAAAGRCDALLYPPDDRVRQLKEKADQVIESMRENLDLLQERGEKVELLEEKTRRLDESSALLPDESQKLKRRKRCENRKCCVGMVVALLALLLLLGAAYGIALAVCGDPLLRGCWSGGSTNDTQDGNDTLHNHTSTLVRLYHVYYDPSERSLFDLALAKAVEIDDEYDDETPPVFLNNWE